jgi:hypothetical protein
MLACGLWLAAERMSHDWHLVEGFTVAGHCSNLSEAEGSSVYSLLSSEGKKGQEILLDVLTQALPDFDIVASGKPFDHACLQHRINHC